MDEVMSIMWNTKQKENHSRWRHCLLISPITNYGPKNTLVTISSAWEIKATELVVLKSAEEILN